MSDWHRVGSREERLARVPLNVTVERHPIAMFHCEGGVRAVEKEAFTV